MKPIQTSIGAGLIAYAVYNTFNLIPHVKNAFDAQNQPTFLEARKLKEALEEDPNNQSLQDRLHGLQLNPDYIQAVHAGNKAVDSTGRTLVVMIFGALTFYAGITPSNTTEEDDRYNYSRPTRVR